VLYGTGAMYAVINVITKNGNSLDGVSVLGEFGSGGLMRASATYGKRIGNKLDFIVALQGTDTGGRDLYFEEFDSPENNYGIADGKDWEKGAGLFSTVSFGNLTLTGLVSSWSKGDPTGAFGTAFNDKRSEVRDQRDFIEYRYLLDVGKNKQFLFRGFGDLYRHKRFYPIRQEGYEGLFVEESNSYSLGQEVRFRWDISAGNRLTLGAEYVDHFRAKLETRDENFYFLRGDFPFNIASAYLQDEFQITRNLSFTAGLRADRYSTIGSFLSPRLALIHHPFSKTTFKFLYSEDFRAPSIYENHFEGSRRNKNLDRELIEILEVIWEQRLYNGISTVVSVYDYKLENIIEKLYAQQYSPDRIPSLSKVTVRGVQIGLNARFGNGVAGYFNYSFQRARVIEPALLELSNSPNHIFKGGLSASLARGVDLAFEFDYESSRLTVRNTRTDAFFLADLVLSSNSLLPNAKVLLKIRNLFNERYRTPGGFEHAMEAITQNGRSLALLLKYQF